MVNAKRARPPQHWGYRALHGPLVVLLLPCLPRNTSRRRGSPVRACAVLRRYLPAFTSTSKLHPATGVSIPPFTWKGGPAMQQVSGQWYVGYVCEGCRKHQAIMPDPDRGKGKTVPEVAALNPRTGKMESVYGPQGIAIQCEGCNQPSVIRAKDLKRWKGVR